MRLIRLLTTVVFLIALAACGGGTGNQVELGTRSAGADAPPAGDKGQAVLPAIPAGLVFQPARITSEYTAGIDASNTYDKSGNVTPSGEVAQFRPAASELAWALYEFSGSDVDNLGSVTYYAQNMSTDAEVWIAVSNYDDGTWQFHGPFASDNETIDISGGAGEHASPAGHTYVAVLGYDSDEFDLASVEVYYPDRYSISGTVVDGGGTGIADVLVTTSIGGAEAMTDVDGNFTIDGVPNGDWHVMASKYGWNFYDQPRGFTIDGADLPGLTLTGFHEYANLEDKDSNEPNDCFGDAVAVDLSEAVNATISAYSDNADYYLVTIPAGHHYLKLVTDESVLLPNAILYTTDQRIWAYTPSAFGGTIFLDLHVEVDREFVLGVFCEGGGGEYSLELVTNSDPLADLTVPVSSLDSGPMKLVVVEASFGGDTVRTVSYSSNGIAVFPFLTRDTWNVTPVSDEYTFTPSSSVVDLSGGPVAMLPFLGTHSLSDAYEPANNQESTAPVLSLPYDSLSESDFASIGGADDFFDIYKFTPSAGKRLQIRLEYNYNIGSADSGGPAFLSLYDQDADEYVDGSSSIINGQELRTYIDTDGGEYRLEIDATGKRTGYSLIIREFDPVLLKFGVEQDGVPIPAAAFKLHSEDLSWERTWIAWNSSGLTTDEWPFIPGEQVHVTCRRFAMSCDGETRIVTADLDKDVIFEADLETDDNYEPNSYNSPHPVSFPVDLSATISYFSDGEDDYVFTPTANEPMLVSYDCDNEETTTGIIVTRVSDGEYMADENLIGSGQFYFIPGGLEPYQIDVYPSGRTVPTEDCGVHYTLQISHSEAYKISGTVTEVGIGHFGPAVYCLETGAIDYPDSDTGAWDLGAFPPGDYTIVCLAANMDVADNPRAVSITDADAEIHFALSYNYEDFGEPNDTPEDATPLTHEVTINAVIDPDNDVDGQDWEDHYTFTPSGEGWVSVTIDVEGVDYLTGDHELRAWIEVDGRYMPNFIRQDNGLMKFYYYEPTGGVDYLLKVIGYDARYSLQALWPLPPE